jgi:hypothetical protein
MLFGVIRWHVGHRIRKPPVVGSNPTAGCIYIRVCCQHLDPVSVLLVTLHLTASQPPTASRKALAASDFQRGDRIGQGEGEPLLQNGGGEAEPYPATQNEALAKDSF